MARKPKKGYFYQGKFIEQDSELDQELKESFKGTNLSKTDLKKQSAELQKIGQELLPLSSKQLASLDLPSKLQEAIAMANSISNFEGKRRQMQFIGKLMRQLDEDKIKHIQAFLDDLKAGSVKQAQKLHLVEQWRDKLVSQDSALTEWLDLYPSSDIQTLRNLIRQIRKEQQKQPANPDGLNRQSKAYRSLFQQLKEIIELVQ